VAERESLANARLWLGFAIMLFVSGIANTFPVFFPPLSRSSAVPAPRPRSASR